MFIMSVNPTITMAISEEDKILIESLYETKGYGTRELLKQFPQKNWMKGGFSRQLGYVLILFLIVTVNKFLK